MLLATALRADGAPCVAARLPDGYVDLGRAHALRHGAAHPGLASMLALMRAGPAALEAAREAAGWGAGEAAARLPADAPLLSPVPVPESVRDFMVFATHIRNSVAQVNAKNGGGPTDPAQVEIPAICRRIPIHYKGNRFSVVGHGAEVRWPSYTRQLDYELEWGVFTWNGGGAMRDVPAARAKALIFGYTVFNDFSARDAQIEEMAGLLGPAKGKDFDTGNAIGPWIATPDEIPDPYALRLSARVNGETWSEGSSADMLHGFEEMIAHVSRDTALVPGEFLGSGTVGFGCGLEHGRWLKPGDLVELEVERIGVLVNRVVGGPAGK